MAFTQFFDVAFGPLAGMGPLYAIAGVSIIISLIFSILYRVLVHQETFKRLKAEQKEMQQKMKNAQKAKDDKALKDLFSSSMSLQNRMMMLTIKPMIASMLVFVIMVPWLSGNYGDITVKLADNHGTLKYKDIAENVSVSSNSATAITVGGKTYSAGDKIDMAGKTWLLNYMEDKKEVILQNVRFELPFNFPLVGTAVGWLGLYIIVSLPATMLFRKILGVD